MRRLAQFAGLLLFAMIVGALAAQIIGTIGPPQRPGSIVIRGETLSTTGCLASLNVSTKKVPCAFTIVAPGIKLPDLACVPIVSMGTDTVINCAYSPIKALSANPSIPNTAVGTVVLPGSLVASISNGCLAYVNHPALNCGFNVALIGIAIPNLTLTTRVSGGNTIVEGSYPAVKPPTLIGTPPTTIGGR